MQECVLSTAALVLWNKQSCALLIKQHFIKKIKGITVLWQCLTDVLSFSLLLFCRNKSEPIPAADQNDMVAKRLEPNSHVENNGQRSDFHEPVKHEPNGVETRDTTPSTPVTPNIEGRMGEKGGLAPHHPNGWGNYGPPNGSRYQSQENVRDMREPHEENVVMRRGFVPRTAPERLAQRKSSMTQLQQWVNQRRAMVPQDDGRRWGLEWHQTLIIFFSAGIL